MYLGNQLTKLTSMPFFKHGRKRMRYKINSKAYPEAIYNLPLEMKIRHRKIYYYWADDYEFFFYLRLEIASSIPASNEQKARKYNWKFSRTLCTPAGVSEPLQSSKRLYLLMYMCVLKAQSVCTCWCIRAFSGHKASVLADVCVRPTIHTWCLNKSIF